MAAAVFSLKTAACRKDFEGVSPAKRECTAVAIEHHLTPQGKKFCSNMPLVPDPGDLKKRTRAEESRGEGSQRKLTVGIKRGRKEVYFASIRKRSTRTEQ